MSAVGALRMEFILLRISDNTDNSIIPITITPIFRPDLITLPTIEDRNTRIHDLGRSPTTAFIVLDINGDGACAVLSRETVTVLIAAVGHVDEFPLATEDNSGTSVRGDSATLGVTGIGLAGEIALLECIDSDGDGIGREGHDGRL
jgi:hypothetical protein